MHITDEYPVWRPARRSFKSKTLENIGWVLLGLLVLLGGMSQRHRACLHPQHQVR